jgi:4-hydroxy-3-methylbut-2-en-1-yl diphosphate reductase
MVDNAGEIKAEWVIGKDRVGLTAGASAPEILVREVIERLKELGIGEVDNLDGTQEKVAFALPKGLA